MKRLLPKLTRQAAIFFCLLTISLRSMALGNGDLLFTSYDATGITSARSFSFLCMTNIAAGTVINFTDRGYIGSGAFSTANTISETSISFVTGATFVAGTEIKITNLAAIVVGPGTSAGTVTPVSSPGGTPVIGLNLGSQDQVIAYQGSLEGSYQVLAGIHWNYCDPYTINTTWDPVGPCSLNTSFGSTMPPGISSASSAFWTGLVSSTTPRAGYFNCNGTPQTISNLNVLRGLILDKANWVFSVVSPSGLTTPAGCTYVTLPPVIDASPSTAIICAGPYTTTFTVTASGAGPISYLWQVSTTGIAGAYSNLSGTNYSDVNTATLKISNVTAAFNNYAYRAVVSNSGGSSFSNGALLKVDNGVPSSFPTQPADAFTCPGGNASFTSTATTNSGSLTYRWQVNTGTGFTDIADGGVYSNSTTTSLIITGAPATMYGYQYRMGATNTCGTGYSNPGTLTFRSNWTGTSSVNWNVAGNWSCNMVPDANTDVVIGTAGNQPTISTVANVRNVTLNTGGTLTIAAANTLGLAGTIVNNGGTLVATNTNSVINFNSTVAGQQVPGGNYYNIQFTGASKVLTGAVNVTGSANILSNLLVYLGNYNLVIGPTGSVSANGSRYFVTNGTGGMKKMGITSTSFVYPLGSGTSYTPFLVNNAGGVSDNFTGRVIDSVYSTYVNDVPQGSPILTNVVNKTWFVTEDVPGGSNVQMIVQWNQADERPGFVRTSCTLSHYRGGGWIAMPLVTSSPATGAGPYTQTRTGITSFSPFGVGGAGSALPVKLESFNGYASSAGNQLTWQTSFEQNLERFVIERSTDGINFTDIGTVKAGTGNSGTYSFLDARPDGSSKQYYRLRIVDLDNSREYSAVVTILPAKQNAGSWSVSPNPVTGDEVVLRPGAAAPAIQQISIVDIAGKTWRNTAGNGAGQPSIDVTALPAGSYVLKLQTAAGVQTLKLQRL